MSFDNSLAVVYLWAVMFFFFQAEDGIRDLVRSRGLGDVYKRQVYEGWFHGGHKEWAACNDCHTPHDLIPKYFVKILSLIHI